MDGKIYTAYAMDADTVLKIAEKFEEKMGAPVNLKQEMDKSLIAGFVVQIGFMRFDYSSKARLKEMMRHMLEEA
jgi:F0F1-type ATP synthase delta subunit